MPLLQIAQEQKLVINIVFNKDKKSSLPFAVHLKVVLIKSKHKAGKPINEVSLSSLERKSLRAVSIPPL